MHRESGNHSASHIRLPLLLTLGALFLIPALLAATGPSWWTTQGVLISGGTANDYAAANQGQVKNLAQKAYAEFQLRLPSTAWTNAPGLALTAFVNGLSTNNNYAPLNLGQLKTVAQPFYDELISQGYLTNYPWSGSTNTPNDYAIANIGQVKNLFAFDVAALVTNSPGGGSGGTGSGGTGTGGGTTGGNGGGNTGGGGTGGTGGTTPTPIIDSDGDGVPDDQDGMPYDPTLSPPRVPEDNYVVIDLQQIGVTGSSSHASNINDSLQILANNSNGVFLWSQGQSNSLPNPSKSGYWRGLSNDGTVGVQADENDGLWECWSPDNGVETLSGIPLDQNTNGMIPQGNGGYEASDAASGYNISEGGTSVGAENGSDVTDEYYEDGSTTVSHSYMCGIIRDAGGSPRIVGDLISMTGITTSSFDGEETTVDSSFECSSGTYFIPASANSANIVVGLGMAVDEDADFGTPEATVWDGTTRLLPKSGDASASFINDGTDSSGPWIVGNDSDLGPVFWAKVGSTWTEKSLPVSGIPFKINNRYEIITYSGELVQNGQSVDLSARTQGSGYSNIAPVDINNNGVILANTSTSQVLLVPIDANFVNRDDLTQNWSSHKPLKSGTVIYAGTNTGDMVEWKINVPSTMGSTYYIWTATDSQGNTITGPSGSDCNAWTIANDGNDPLNTWLTWHPDTYTISCNVSVGGSNTTAQFQQKVGWRTEDYLVIGQIVTTHTYDGSGPTNDLTFRPALLGDISISGFGSGFIAANAAANLPDAALGFIDFGAWGATSHAATPQGPISYFGAITEAHRYWMLQNALNGSIDSPTAPAQIPFEQLIPTVQAQKYRLLHNYQARFCLTSGGKIDMSTFSTRFDTAALGPTKLVIPAGTFSSYGWNNGVIPIWELTGETNPHNGQEQTSSDGLSRSQYASGRIGTDGQNVNWRIFGQDVPWIYSEIIYHVNGDRTVQSSIKTSVDITWQDGSKSGTCNFNNLNIYRLKTDPNDASSMVFVRVSGGLLPMDGQLKGFIESVPGGTWPSPAPAPSVQ